MMANPKKPLFQIKINRTNIYWVQTIMLESNNISL